MSSLNANDLRDVLIKTRKIDLDVTVHELVDSTNTWSVQQCKSGRVIPFACFAENQTLGRGRRGKQWLTSARSNIAMSVCWVFDLTQQLPLLSLSVALAVAKTLEKLNIEGVQIKWPNDVYVQNKKIAGILIEAQAIKREHSVAHLCENISNEERVTAAVIGVGLNYDMSSLESVIENNSFDLLPVITDVKREIKKQNIVKKVNRELVAAVLLENVVSVCQNFHQNSQQNIKEFGECYDYCKGKLVDLKLDNQDILSGIAQGVNERAELIVVVDGETLTFNSADISVRVDS